MYVSPIRLGELCACSSASHGPCELSSTSECLPAMGHKPPARLKHQTLILLERHRGSRRRRMRGKRLDQIRTGAHVEAIPPSASWQLSQVPWPITPPNNRATSSEIQSPTFALSGRPRPWPWPYALRSSRPVSRKRRGFEGVVGCRICCGELLGTWI